MQGPPSSRPMDYAQATAELHRMTAQFGNHVQEPTPRHHFPDEFSTPGASRERPLHFDAYGSYGSTTPARPSFMPAFDQSYTSFNSPGGVDSGPATPGPAVVEAYRELNNKAAVVNQQRLAAQRERDRLRAELDLYLKQEGLQRIPAAPEPAPTPTPAPAVDVDAELRAKQTREQEREEVRRQQAELKRQMQRYEELRKAEEAASARYD